MKTGWGGGHRNGTNLRHLLEAESVRITDQLYGRVRGLVEREKAQVSGITAWVYVVVPITEVGEDRAIPIGREGILWKL